MVKPRPWSSLLVLFVGVVLALVAESACPPISALRLPLNALLGVLIYYSQRREFAYSLVAALLCAVLADGLGSDPAGVRTLVYLALWGLIRIFFHKQFSDSIFSCILIGALAAPMLLIFGYAAQYLVGRPGLPSVGFALLRSLVAVLSGAFSALLVAAFLRGLDWISANVGLNTEDDDEGFE